MVQIKKDDGTWEDVTNKTEMEEAIMDSTKKKYTASFHTPFMTRPLVNDFGFQGVGRSVDAVLDGTYITPTSMDEITKQFIKHLKQPEHATAAGDYPTSLPTTEFKKYWLKAREHTSCYPGPLSFSTMKASAQDDIKAELECVMARIPVFAGFAPQRWRRCVDVMIQ